MIRHAQEKDFEQVFRMYFDRSRNRFLYYDPMEESEFTPYWQKMLKRRHTYVLETRGEVRGFISAARREGQEKHVVYISPIIVKRGNIGKGIGHKLMEFLLGKLKYTSGVKRVELIVNSDNEKAVGFFKKFGFEIEAVRKKGTEREGEYIDDFMMVLLFN